MSKILLQCSLSSRCAQRASWSNPWKRFHKSLNASVLGWFLIQKVHEVSCAKLYYKQGCLQKDLLDRHLHAALNPFLVGPFRALFEVGSAKLHHLSSLLIETCYSHKKWCIYRSQKLLSKIAKKILLTSAVFVTYLTKICMILLKLHRIIEK